MLRDNKIKKVLGLKGEQAAERFLSQKGYEILDRNYRLRGGEVDLIAKDGEVLVFVEVKTRISDKFGDPVYAVTPHKQGQMSKVALAYLQEKGVTNCPCRFDVLTLIVKGNRAKVTHFKNAFPPSSMYDL